MMSVPRALAEWKMATAVVQRELGEGDILVLDGTLQTGYGGEARLADTLYDRARKRGIIVCALAKTTTMMGPGGIPVLYAAQEAARKAGHRTWYMPLARRASGGDGSGFMLAVRLHRHSRFTYRFEVLRDQYDSLVEAGQLGEVVGSIAANSGDPSFPGSRTGWSAPTGTRGCAVRRAWSTAVSYSVSSGGTSTAGRWSTIPCSCRPTRRSTGPSGGDGAGCDV